MAHEQEAEDYDNAERDPQTGELVGNPGVRKKLVDTAGATHKALENIQIPMGPEPETTAPATAEEDDGKGPFGNGEYDQAMSAERDENGNLVQ